MTTLAPVEVVGTSPLPGAEVPEDQVPANVQRADAARLRRAQSLDLADFMSMRLTSVDVNDTQGSPFQREVSYRGFTASPLLGAPQGLSVYLDGVRVNEAFGDVVNWDLIPTHVLESVSLLPGSNPLFGLNTLGGALALRTKSGDTNPGGELSLQGGSFGRISGDFSYGRRLGDHGHVFVALSGSGEDGWRDDSPSRLRQVFVKIGERAPDSSWSLSLLQGDTRLVGNGLLPESMLTEDRRQTYTDPDQTDNHLTMLTLGVNRRLGGGLELSANAYTRELRASTVNGDVNDDFSPPENTDAGIEHRTQTRSRSVGLAPWST